MSATLYGMSDNASTARHCCIGTDCPGERMMECEHAAFYAEDGEACTHRDARPRHRYTYYILMNPVQ